MSLCAVVHILGDSVTLSQHLLHLVSSLRNLSWTGCPAGELVASDRACYAAPAFFYAMVLLHLVTTALLLVRGAALPGGLGGLGMLFYADWGSVVNVELIVPDILLELLAASHPLVVANRTLVHFFLCVLLVTASTVVCSPGGATMASIFVHNQDRDLRFLVLFLESVVVLQFCVHLLRGGVLWVQGSQLPVPHMDLRRHGVAVSRAAQLHPSVCHCLHERNRFEYEGLPSPSSGVGPGRLGPGHGVQAAHGPGRNGHGGPSEAPRRTTAEGKVKKSSSSSSSTEVLGSPDLFVASHTNPSPGSGNSRKGSLGSPRNRAGNPGPGVVPDSGTVHVSRRLSSIRRSMMRPKPPTVEYVSSEVTKSSRPAAASTGTSGDEPPDHRPHKTGSDRGASQVEGPYLPEAPGQADNQAGIAALLMPGPQLAPVAPDIPKKIQEEKLPGKMQDAAVVLQHGQAEREPKKSRAQKAVSKSKLSNKSSVSENAAVKPEQKAGTVSQGSGASLKNLAGAQELRPVERVIAAEVDLPPNPDAGKTAGSLQEEPKKALKRLKEGVVLRRKRRKHRKAASAPHAVRAESQDDARAPAASSPESDSARHTVVVRAPSVSTIDKSTAFRSMLRNLLLRPEERANMLQRTGKVTSSEAVAKGRILASSPWFSLDSLRTAPSAGAAHQETTAVMTRPGHGPGVLQREGATSGGRGLPGVMRGSNASLHTGQPTVAEAQPKDNAPLQHAKRQARRKLKADDSKRKVSVVGSVQERENQRKASAPSMSDSSRHKRPSGSQAELAFHASSAQAPGATSRETRPQSSMVVSTRTKRSEHADGAGNTVRESRKSAEGENDQKDKEGRQKSNRA
ncbi:hypothetical protein V5799_001481 [Amblyomma americanum]|uniref:Transmembrane protein n=1 Tax=Amblyomma americanum TaxID=6943 RepID=A0AAQ4D032_AMBAM